MQGSYFTDGAMNALEIISEIIARKREQKRAPEHAMRLEVLSMLKDSGDVLNMDRQLTELLDDGIITAHPTSCDTAYTIIQNPTDNAEIL